MTHFGRSGSEGEGVSATSLERGAEGMGAVLVEEREEDESAIGLSERFAPRWGPNLDLKSVRLEPVMPDSSPSPLMALSLRARVCLWREAVEWYCL